MKEQFMEYFFLQQTKYEKSVCLLGTVSTVSAGGSK